MYANTFYLNWHSFRALEDTPGSLSIVLKHTVRALSVSGQQFIMVATKFVFDPPPPHTQIVLLQRWLYHGVK